MTVFVRLRQIVLFVWLIIRYLPQFILKVFWHAVVLPPLQIRRDRRRFIAGYRKAAIRARRGPNLAAIPQTTVDTIEQYLGLCRELETKHHYSQKFFYRGQTANYFLPGTTQISLPPVLGREEHRTPPHYSFSMERAWRDYLTEARSAHIQFGSRTDAEASVFEEALMLEDLAPNPAARKLRRTPMGRFLVRFFPGNLNPYLFEAALQHYGFPTLNLDATYSPLVALYFATHAFRRDVAGALVPSPTLLEGFVYVMSVPTEDVARQMTRSFSLSTTEQPRLADLFDLTFDNDSRPRRQYGVLLTEAGQIHLPNAPEFNCAAYSIQHIVRLSEKFWRTEGSHAFLAAQLGPFLFPSMQVDSLFRALRNVSPRWFPSYNCGPRQSRRHPAGRFEFTCQKHIVLTGSDSENVKSELMPTWHAQADWIEVLPLEEVLRRASDPTETEPMDIVLSCEPFIAEADKLDTLIHDTARKAGRLLVCIPTGHFGTVVRSPGSGEGGIADALRWADDPYDSDYLLQNQLFEAMLLLSRLRYDKHMKPEPKDWENFLKYVNWAVS